MNSSIFHIMTLISQLCVEFAVGAVFQPSQKISNLSDSYEGGFYGKNT